MVCKAKLKGQQCIRLRAEKQTRWWNLEDQTFKKDFVEKVKERTLDGDTNWDAMGKIV